MRPGVVLRNTKRAAEIPELTLEFGTVIMPGMFDLAIQQPVEAR